MVINNQFINCNGEIEVVSNKSGQNIYYANYMENSEGTITLRHGNGCIVYKNHFNHKKNYHILSKYKMNFFRYNHLPVISPLRRHQNTGKPQGSNTSLRFNVLEIRTEVARKRQLPTFSFSNPLATRLKPPYYCSFSFQQTDPQNHIS